MKINWKNVVIAAIMCPSLLIGGATSVAKDAPAAIEGALSHKEEVIYALLSPDGSVRDMYAVNILDVTRAGTVTDYGDYAAVKNLTSTGAIESAGDSVSVSAQEGRFYYQGDMVGKALPWDISITYFLDGEAVAGSELAGKSGELIVAVKTRQNQSADPAFFESYMLQIQITMDSAKCRNIRASGATFANAGLNKLATFTVMPKKQGDILLAADVTDFEMEGISINALPFSMDIDIGDTSQMTDGIEKLTDSIGELNDGVSDLLDGAGKLKNGFSDLSGGITDVADASVKLHEGAIDLTDGAFELAGGSAEINDGLRKLTGRGAAELVDGVYEMRKGLNQLSAGLKSQTGSFDLTALAQLPDALEQAAGALDGIAQAVGVLEAYLESAPSSQISEGELNAVVAGLSGDSDLTATFSELTDYYTWAEQVKAVYGGIKAASPGVTLNESILGVSAGLKTMAGGIRTSLSSGTDITAQMKQLSDGISELASGMGELSDGIRQYVGGVGELAEGYAEFDEGVRKLADGMAEYADGAGEFADGTQELLGGAEEFGGGVGDLRKGVKELNDGTQEMFDETRDMPEEMQKAIDDITSDYTASFVPRSFVCAKNKNVESVQFVIKTDAVRPPKENAAPAAEAGRETFWSRLLALFKKDGAQP